MFYFCIKVYDKIYFWGRKADYSIPMFLKIFFLPSQWNVIEVDSSFKKKWSLNEMRFTWWKYVCVESCSWWWLVMWILKSFFNFFMKVEQPLPNNYVLALWKEESTLFLRPTLQHQPTVFGAVSNLEVKDDLATPRFIRSVLFHWRK